MIEKDKKDTKPSETNSLDQEKKTDDNIFSTTEVKIEEMAIDGICGVYWIQPIEYALIECFG